MPLVGKATVNNNILNEFITETILNLSKTCAAKALNKMEIGADSVAGDVTIGGKITQTASADLKCTQKSDLQAAMKSEMANVVKQSASSKDSSIITGDVGLYSESTTNNNTVNRNIMKTSLDDVMTCLSEATNEFKVRFGSVGGNFTFNPTSFDQNAKAKVSKCVQNTGWSQKVSVAVKNDITQDAKNVGTLDSLMDGLGRIVASVMMLVIGVAVLGGIAFIAYSMFSKKSGDGKEDKGFFGGLLDSVTQAAAETAKAATDGAAAAAAQAADAASKAAEAAAPALAAVATEAANAAVPALAAAAQ